MRRRPLLYFTYWLVVWFGGSGAAAAPWRDGPTDIPNDPAVRFGRLDNGVRYAVMHNETPKGRISLRLLVAAGSILENDDQLGIAHFVEHMAFRGTRHFPHDKLLPALERMGLGFGADSLAFTTRDYTEYRLELPDPGDSTIETGLSVLRDFAGEVSFDPRAVDIERGVVLSEAALRWTPEFSVGQKNLAYLFPGSRIARRSPIGSPALLRTFRADQLRKFYHSWYQPDRLYVIAVGDADPAALTRLIAAHFSSFRSRAPEPAEPPDLTPIFQAPPDVAVIAEPGWSGGMLFLEHPVEHPDRPSTHAQRTADVQTELAMEMFKRRLEICAQRPGASFAGPNAEVAASCPGWLQAQCTVSIVLPDLSFAVRDLEQEHRRAVLFGFSPAELLIAQQHLMMALRFGVRTKRTRDSRGLAEQIEGHAFYGLPMSSPEATLSDLGGAIEACTVQDCLRAFRAAWTKQAPNVLLVTRPPAPVSPKELAAAFNRSRAAKVAAPPPETLGNFDYTYFGPVSPVTADRYLPDLHLHLAQYGNGVALNFKATPFDENEVEFCVRVGTGRASVPRFHPSLPTVTTTGFIRGGLGEFNSQQISDILGGHDLQVQFMVDNDALCFYGRCAQQELPRALQVVAAYITDPAFRPEALHDVQIEANGPVIDEQARADGVIANRLLWLLSGRGDWRYAPAQWSGILNTSYATMADWVLPQLAFGSVEASVVGDVSWEQTKQAMAQSLAQLRPRRPRTAASLGEPLQAFTAGPQRIIYHTSPQVHQACLCYLWALSHFTNITASRVGYLSAAVLRDRIIDRLRIQLGHTYSPEVEFDHYDAPPGLAFLKVQVMLSSPLIPAASAIIDGEVSQLRLSPPELDAFRRAREPLLRGIADEMRDNTYWLWGVLQRASEVPINVESPRNRIAGYQALVPEDVHQFFHYYIRRECQTTVVTYPTAAPPPVR
ncbi:MAG TPA: insulinase family protein [Opitutaceae bacterium]